MLSTLMLLLAPLAFITFFSRFYGGVGSFYEGFFYVFDMTGEAIGGAVAPLVDSPFVFGSLD
jgi:hypothetical protein